MSGFTAEKPLCGQTIPQWQGLLKSNTIIAVGDALRGNAGYLDVTNITNTIAIVGVSTSSQSSNVTSNPEILFVPNVPDIIFSGECSGTGAQTIVWTLVDIEGGTGAMKVNEDANSVKALNILGKREDQSWGSGTIVYFQFAKSRFTGRGQTA
jgi:hypothetical protein